MEGLRFAGQSASAGIRRHPRRGEGADVTAPERIHHWQHTQLSIARHFGGIAYNGAHYRIAVNEPGMPLVRADVLAREAREARKAKRADDAAQGELLL